MKIVYAPRAFADLTAIESYIVGHHPAAARRVLAVIKSTIDDMHQFPRLGPSIDHEGRHRLPVGRFPYVIYYRITSDEIQILHIRHGSQQVVSQETLAMTP